MMRWMKKILKKSNNNNRKSKSQDFKKFSLSLKNSKKAITLRSGTVLGIKTVEILECLH